MKYSDIEKDIQIIELGGFWCEVCLAGNPSPDERYCLSCYDFLNKEGKLLSGSPAWKPKITCYKPAIKAKSAVENLVSDATPINLNMSTLDGFQNKVDKNSPQGTKRGRKRKPIPIEQISKLASEGLGAKAISTKLKRGRVVVSYKTIQRIIARVRV